MFLDSTGTISVSFPPGWAFDALSSSLTSLVFLDWTAPNERQAFIRVIPSHTDAGASDDNWETVVRSITPTCSMTTSRRGPRTIAQR